MNDVVITVRGDHETRLAPEQGVVHVVVRADGPERGLVVERIAALAEPLRTGLTAREEQGGLVEWSSRRVSVWAERPWTADGTQLALVHHASVEFSATFTDFAVLSWWVAEIMELDGVQLTDVRWQLSTATAARVEQETATAAVRVALERATAYAAALGLATVTPVEIADPGLLSRGDAGAMSGSPRMMTAAFASDGGAGIALRPDDVVVSAAVEGRFSAR